MFKKIAIAAIGAAFVVATSAAVMANGPGKCGKGMKWDAGNGKCVAKATKGSGSGATKGKGSGSGSG
jgi:hypothetical protein